MLNEDGTIAGILDILDVTHSTLLADAVEGGGGSADADGAGGWLKWRLAHALRLFTAQQQQAHVWRDDVSSVTRDNLRDITARPDQSVMSIARRMAADRITAVLVVEASRGAALAGIFTERDVVTRVVVRGLDPETTSLDQVRPGNAGLWVVV